MSILIIGNVSKDVYLSLDEHSESLESDRIGTKWLNLGFNGQNHHYYNRISTFGGAAVSLEVMTKFGFSASISGSHLDLSRDADPDFSYKAKKYNYIFTSEDSACFFAEQSTPASTFVQPDTPPDYLYLDHSASLTPTLTRRIITYLDEHPEVNFVVSVNPSTDEQLIRLADIVLDDPDFTNPRPKFLDLAAKNIYHATYFCAKLSGHSEEESLALAHENLFSSKLDSTLDPETLRRSLLDQKHVSHHTSELELIAATLMTRGKGILAADESGGSIKKKFAILNIPDDYAHRHAYRDLFFTTPHIEDYLSGIILFDETARDHMSDLTAIPDYLTAKRIIPGIKVDQGLAPFNDLGETITRGLDSLPARLHEYHAMGLRFAKWRAAFSLTRNAEGLLLTPTESAITKNCQILAEYAAACQTAGLVPIVEPEVIYDGNYSLDDSFAVTAKVLDTLHKALVSHSVNLRACLYKINMITAGKQYHSPSTPSEVATATHELLFRHVPKNLAGVVFLSGGQTSDEATANLAAILAAGPYPFPVTFSFARALQDPALYAWRGNPLNQKAAKSAFLSQLKNTAAALQ